MEISVEPSKTYAVTTSGSCTVTDADGLELCTASSGSQAFFVATTPTVTISDDGAKVSRATFNHALAALGLLGGGDKLPAGYTRLEFLESTGSQYINTKYSEGCTAKFRYAILKTSAFDDGRGRWGQSGALDNDRGAVWLVNRNGYFNLYACYTFEDACVKGQFYDVTHELCDNNSILALTVNGVRRGTIAYSTYTPVPYNLFDTRGNQARERLEYCSISSAGKLVRDFLPALDPAGIPCMFDLVTRKPFYNSGTGQFIVGFTLAQVRGLRLPAGGGQLTLSLPYEASVDMRAQEALEAAILNGWTLSIQYQAGELPADWHRGVSFLESTGEQYIDTGVNQRKDDVVLCEYAWCQSNSVSQILWGSLSSGCLAQWVRYSSTYRPFMTYGGGNAISAKFVPAEGELVKTEVNAGQFFVNGTYVGGYELPSDYSMPITLCGSSLYRASAKLYSFSVSRAGTPQLNLQPCIDAEGIPCMWDSVSKQALYNEGSEPFIVGLESVEDVRKFLLPPCGGKLTLSLPHEASIDRLAQAALERARANGWELTLQYAEAEVPAGYRRLDFLESTGTQYIGTGVTIDNESEVICTFESRAKEYTDYEAIFGTRTDFSNGITLFYPSSSIDKGNLIFTLEFQIPAEFGKKASAKLNKTELKYGDEQRSNKGSITGEILNMLLFCVNTSGAAQIIKPYYYSKARIYSFSIARAGEMQVDYVPCIAPDGKLGMFNKVDGTVKENAGSGAFIAGLATVDDVRKLWLPETSGELTVSVPADTPDSAEQQLRKNNPTWQIAIQYRTDNEN